ncbi:MAG: DNA-binding protein [Deltaproteobacteria bacterium]|nr:MAG: DNA-binding protein [Deltaproteobacteria bacterium]
MTKLISAEKLAENLPISPKTLYNWAKLREIPHYRLGGRVLFDPEEVETWLQSHKVIPAA